MGINVIEQHIVGINFAIEFCCAIFISIIMAAVILKNKQTKEIKNFILFTLTSALSLWTDVICYMCEGNTSLVVIMKIMNVASFTMTSFSALTYLTYVLAYFEDRFNKKYKRWVKNVFTVYCSVCSVFYMSSLWTGLLFTIDDNSVYYETDYSYISGLMLLPTVFVTFVAIIKHSKNAKKRDINLLLANNIIYPVFGIIDAANTWSLHYIFMTIFIILIYIFINIENEKTLEVKSKELAISELNALRLQMNPHFVYNTLASIDGLIMIDPDEARSLIGKFTKHLRSSYLDNSPNTVPFETELENIKCYLSVEEIRFPNIKIEYDLGVTDFELPPLTVQPILENAVKHGICGREDGKGTIVISTYETDKSYNISIKDNGVGFDVKAPRKKDGRSHIGVDNTKVRLELLCNGRLEINSIVGVGTESTIIIPKE